MIRHVFFGLIAAISIEWLGSCVSAQNEQREMPYSPRTSIADRLLPSDKQVLVYKKPSEVYGPVGEAQTYEQEIKRLQQGDIIALVRVGTVHGELIDQGTWIRTNVIAQVERVVRNNVNRPLGQDVEFSISGGQTQIGSVEVTAGVFPRFNEGDQYLVILVEHPRLSLTYALHVNAAGTLEPLKSNTGTEQSSRTHLIGKAVSQVMEALTSR